MRDDHWTSRAACRNHPLLDADAWFEIRGGVPRGDGLRAVLVCRFACPVRAECGKLKHDRNTIAAGGWTNNKGTFVHPGDGDFMDLELAATYLGVSTDRLARQIHRFGVRSVGTLSGRKLYHIVDIDELADRIKGMPHGSINAYKLHILRGERPCTSCARTAITLALPVVA